MTLRRTIGRALHAMTTTSAPTSWEADPRTETTTHAVHRLDLSGERLEVVALRDSLATTKAQLAETRRQRDDALAALDAETRQRTYAEQSLARLTRDVALRTTQRDKARSDRDRALVELEALRAEMDPPC